MSDKKNINNRPNQHLIQNDKNQDDIDYEAYSDLADPDKFQPALNKKKRISKNAKTKDKLTKKTKNNVRKNDPIEDDDEFDDTDQDPSFLSSKSDSETDELDDNENEYDEEALILKGKIPHRKQNKISQVQKKRRRSYKNSTSEQEDIDEDVRQNLHNGTDFGGNSDGDSEDNQQKQFDDLAHTNVDSGKISNQVGLWEIENHKISDIDKAKIYALKSFVNIDGAEFDSQKQEILQIIDQKFQLYFKRCKALREYRLETKRETKILEERIFCSGAKLCRDIKSALEVQDFFQSKKLISLLIRPFLKANRG